MGRTVVTLAAAGADYYFGTPGYFTAAATVYYPALESPQISGPTLDPVTFAPSPDAQVHEGSAP